jgi:hypothetical protein
VSHVIKIFPADIAFEGDSEKTLLDSALDSVSPLNTVVKTVVVVFAKPGLIAGKSLMLRASYYCRK